MSDVPMIYSFVAVTSVILIGIFFVGLFYVDIAARRVVKRMATDEFGDEILTVEARTANGGGSRGRREWLESRQAVLPGAVRTKAFRVLAVHLWCRAAMMVVFVLWIIALLIDWLRPVAT